MEPRPRLEVQRRRQNDDEDADKPDESDVDSDEDVAWDKWVNDDSGEVKVPLTPVDQPEMGIHAPTPEMDEEDERRQQNFERRRRNPDDPESAERGVWEMKK